MSEALRIRVEAFFRLFPFIAEFTEAHRVEEPPTVQPIDLDLLDCCGYTSAWHRRWIDYSGGHELLYLLDEEGNLIKELRPSDRGNVRTNIFRPSTWFASWSIEGETVHEAIQTQDNTDDIRYVLKVFDSLHESRFLHSDPSHGVKIALYKVPKDWVFAYWIIHLEQAMFYDLRDSLVAMDEL